MHMKMLALCSCKKKISTISKITNIIPKRGRKKMRLMKISKLSTNCQNFQLMNASCCKISKKLSRDIATLPLKNK